MTTREKLGAIEKARKQLNKSYNDELLIIIIDELIKTNKILTSIHDKYVRNIN